MKYIRNLIGIFMNDYYIYYINMKLVALTYEHKYKQSQQEGLPHEVFITVKEKDSSCKR